MTHRVRVLLNAIKLTGFQYKLSNGQIGCMVTDQLRMTISR